MRLVLDASAVLEVVLERSRAGDFMRAIQEADTVMAPELLMVNPEGKAPPIRAQVSVPAPPLACTVAL